MRLVSLQVRRRKRSISLSRCAHLCQRLLLLLWFVFPPFRSLNTSLPCLLCTSFSNPSFVFVNLVDYTFLTDFFLIYRLFITPMALLKLIIVRFHWALVDDSPQRQIVRIRTFVTLRHWLLNYFEFDFMRSKDLRQTLGLYLRSLTKHPRVTNSMREQRIVKELRRYVQSLKMIHYRKLAQQKLEKQSRKQQQQLMAERRRRLQARRSSAGRQGIFIFMFFVLCCIGFACMMKGEHSCHFDLLTSTPFFHIS